MTEDTAPPGPIPGDDDRMQHPAFGLVRLSRVSGQTSLFASPLEHMHWMRLAVFRAEVSRHHYETKVLASERLPLIEIDMSPAQFAELITSAGIFDGTPCTIRSVGGERVTEGIPREAQRQTFEIEFREKTEEVRAAARQFAAEVDALLGDTRLTRDQKGKLQALAMKFDRIVDGTMPFMQEQFDEAMGKTVSAAKADIHGHITSGALALGLEGLRALGGEAQRPGPRMVIDGDTQMPRIPADL